MGRRCLILASAMAALGGANCHAQWYGGYTEAATPYSAAVRSEAEMTMAQGAAAESLGKAAISREEARSAYIDNEAKFIQLRRENRDIKDAREAQKKQEQKASAEGTSGTAAPAQASHRTISQAVIRSIP